MEHFRNSQERLMATESKVDKVVKEQKPVETEKSVKLDKEDTKPNVVEGANGRDSFTLDTKKGLDIEVPNANGLNFGQLQGLINIHLHFHNK